MSAFRGILTGYGIAAIKNKEAKDNAKMEVVKSAGIDFLENKVPQHEKEMRLYEKDFNAVALVHGEDIANLFGDADAGFYGTGKGLENVNGVIKQKLIDKERLKNFKFSSQEDRISKKKSAFQKKSDQMKNLTGIGGMGSVTVANQLEGFGETEPSDQTTIPAPVDMGTIKENVEDAPDTTQATSINQDVSTLFSDRPDTVGIESKFNNITKSVNEQYRYGETIEMQDGTMSFKMNGAKVKEANAHYAISNNIAMSKNVNQINAASLGKQELDSQVFTPFKIIEFSVDNMKYSPGDGENGKAILGDISTEVDSVTTTIKEMRDGKKVDTGLSVYEFIRDIYDNDLLKDDSGNVSKPVFDKFLENLPVNIMYNGESLKSVFANAHQMQYFKNN